MEPNDKEKNNLAKAINSIHGLKFGELLKQSKRLVSYIKGLSSFKFVESDPLLNIPHVGRVIVDAVLQVGHDYEKQVRKRVKAIIKNDESVTVTGFLRVLKRLGINELLNWNSHDMENDLLSVGYFFVDRGINTYSELKEWLKSENNRDSLLSERSQLGGNSTFRVADKTADYFRVLVSHWDAVAVDSNIKVLIETADITLGYNYKEIRSIVQLAAIEINLNPIDLDASIYNDSIVHPELYKKRNKRRQPSICERLGKIRITEEPAVIMSSMPKKGDIFEGRINDLSLCDAEGWKRRDIWFFKHELNRREKFDYPKSYNRIILLDTDRQKYEMNFSKPDLETKVCLGTTGKLKPWYRKKGFNDKDINPNERIYFEYTGNGIDFIVMTEKEYNSRYMEKVVT